MTTSSTADTRTFYEKFMDGAYQNLGNFELTICNAYTIASGTNQDKLKKAYPEYFVSPNEVEMIKFSDALRNHLVESAANRERINGWSKKWSIITQQEMFIGAMVAIDYLNGQLDITNGKSCVPADLWVDMLRGNKIEKK